MKEISGHTRLFGILADPIHHVKTPQRMNEHFARLGFDGVCVPFHARPAELAQVVQGLRLLQNLGGFIVTMPHKTAILTWSTRPRRWRARSARPMWCDATPTAG